MAQPGSISNLISALMLVLLIAAMPNLGAAPESEDLTELYGVWFGRGMIENDVVSPNLVAGFEADVAIWKSTNGFNLTWRNLGLSEGTRATIHFVEGDESNQFDVEWTNLPVGPEERLWAQFKDNSLIVFRMLEEGDIAHVARYRFSVQAGYLTFNYDRSQSNKLLETDNLTLHRVKVIM